MNKEIIGILSFTAGAAVSAALTLYFMSDRYEKKLRSEIKETRELYKDSLDTRVEALCHKYETRIKELSDHDNESTNEFESEVSNIKDDQSHISKGTRRTDYTSYSEQEAQELDKSESAVPSSEPVEESPYVITPDDFGELDMEGYDSLTFHYYLDNILTDDHDEILDSFETVGFDFMNHFGEYDDNVVYIRNDKLMADYEILAENFRYDDIH